MAETKIDLKDLEKAWKDVADWTKDAKVEVTNQKEVQTVDGEVSISNLPEPVDVQKVEMTNQKDVIFPDLQNVKDADVRAELESIKGTQAEIIAALKNTNESLLETNKKLEGTINTQVIGSIVEYGWKDSDTEPVPKEDFAMGVRIESDHTMTVLYWTGSLWNEVG